MSTKARKGKPTGKRKGVTAPAKFTAGQVWRQVGWILVVVAVWAGLLVAVLRLTSTTGAEGSESLPPAGSTPTAVAAVAEVSFAKGVQPLLEERCSRCHGGDQTQAGLNLLSYASVLAGSRSGVVVVPGSSANSKLVGAIVSGVMPQGGPKLSEADIETIRAWVDAGAQDN